MKKLLVLGLALVAVLFLGGCMFIFGSTYGSVSWDSYYYFYTDPNFGYTSGFPSTIYNGSQYTVEPGDYSFYYYLEDPADSSTSSYWYVSYSVTSPLLMDQYFDVYCYWNYGGDVTWASLKSQGGTKTTEDYTGPIHFSSPDGKVEFTVTKVNLSEAERAKFVKR